MKCASLHMGRESWARKIITGFTNILASHQSTWRGVRLLHSRSTVVDCTAVEWGMSRSSAVAESPIRSFTHHSLLQAGQSASLPGDLTFTNSGPSTIGAFETDEYEVKVPGLFHLGLTLRAAHYLLRTPDDAMVHINVQFTAMHPTARVHGIMGQTYRKEADREGRAQQLRAVNALLRHPAAADGATGRGFLDGTVADYLTSAADAADCRFSAFAGGHAATA